MKFYIRGKWLDLTKKELEEMLAIANRPKYTIKSDSTGIDLFADGKPITTLLHPDGENSLNNLSNLAYELAEILNDSMSTKDRLDRLTPGYTIIYHTESGKWKCKQTNHVPSLKNFNTKWVVEDVVKALNKSKDIGAWMSRMLNNG